MFERFTDRARRATTLALEEARLLNHSVIGTEHLLLGLIHEGEGVAAKALETLGISLEAAREKVEAIVPSGATASTGHMDFTDRSKKIIELSLREALQLGHNYIGTEHLLLGIIREGQGTAAQVLVEMGADLSRVRQQTIQLLTGYSVPSGKPEPGAESGPKIQFEGISVRPVGSRDRREKQLALARRLVVEVARLLEDAVADPEGDEIRIEHLRSLRWHGGQSGQIITPTGPVPHGVQYKPAVEPERGWAEFEAEIDEAQAAQDEIERRDPDGASLGRGPDYSQIGPPTPGTIVHYETDRRGGLTYFLPAIVVVSDANHAEGSPLPAPEGDTVHLVVFSPGMGTYVELSVPYAGTVGEDGMYPARTWRYDN